MSERSSEVWLRVGPLAAGLLVAVACAAGWVGMSPVRQNAIYHFHPGVLAAASVWACRRRGERRVAVFAVAITALINLGGWLIAAGGGSMDASFLIAAIGAAGFAAGSTAPVGAYPRVRLDAAESYPVCARASVSSIRSCN